MSKSIFIMETPGCCGMCPMSGTDVCRKWNMKDLNTFPKDCPLVKMPFKIAETGRYGGNVYFAEGYNACIDQIMKEVNENEKI